MLQHYAKRMKIKFEKMSLHLKNCKVEPDAYSESPPILVEAWAHIGKLKDGQRNKILSDALKLLYIDKKTKRSFKKVILFSNEETMNCFLSNSWWSKALSDFGIELEFVEIDKETENMIIEAQKQQALGMSKK